MSTPGRPDERPNVLLIQADQFRWDCLGAAGNPDVRTPHLDQLAASGVRYTSAFCALPVCTPSRYSMLSGLYPHQHAGWSNRSTLAPGIDTIPRALARVGYDTAAVGKMHFTPTYLDVGYRRMELAEQNGPGRYDDDYHRELRAAGLAPVVDLTDQEPDVRGEAPASYWRTFGAQPSDLPAEWHSTTWIGDRAVRELEGWSGNGGNALHVSFVKPHHPFDPPAPWDELYDPEDVTILSGWTDEVPEADRPFQPGYFDNAELTEATLRRVMAYYYATITQLDHQVGRILDTLREQGQSRNTLVVFTADHGEYLGFHHQLLKAGRWLYDPLVRVPLLIRFPDEHRRGAVDDTLVSHLDLAPTVCAVTGTELKQPMPGHDLTGHGHHRDVVVTEAAGGSAYMARSATHKLLRTDDARHDALFDLRTDPYELNDVLGQPAYAEEHGSLDAALTHELLFRAPAPTYIHEAAPCIDAPNVPTHSEGRRAATREYFAARVAAGRAGTGGDLA